MASFSQYFVQLAIAAALASTALASNETTTAPQTTYAPLSGIATNTDTVNITVCLTQNTTSITNFTTTFADAVKTPLANALSVNSSQINSLTTSSNGSACISFTIISGSDSPYTTAARLQHLLNSTTVTLTMSDNTTYTMTSTGFSVSGDPIETTTAAATTATTATNAAITTVTTAAAGTTVTTAATTATTTTAAFVGVRNEASEVTAEMALPGNFSAVSNSSAFIAEVKPQIASKLSLNESQIKNMEIRSGSIIIKFDIVSGSGSSPATALGTLRSLITSGSLAITSTALGNITANASYIVGYEVTTQAPSTAASNTVSATTTASSILSCYVCNGTALCNSYQKTCDIVNNCTSGQHCWTDRVQNANGNYHRRYCGTSCTSTYNNEYCVSTASQTVCRKCCNSANCNVDVLTGSSNIIAAPSSIILICLIVLAQFLISDAQQINS